MLNATLGLLPVLAFLGGLMLLDSFKLVPVRSVLLAIASGAVAALACWALHVRLIPALGIDGPTFSKYVAPLTEESAKALPGIFLLLGRRIGFLVDATIYGFAIGAGFALVENVNYLGFLGGASPWLWLARGFGTALLHGCTTALFVLIAKRLRDANRVVGLSLVPGWAAALVVHSLYNHFLLPPLAAAGVLCVGLPVLVVVSFELSERATRDWLGVGFDSDVELLETIVSGRIRETRVGAYLKELKDKFSAEVVVDMLCLLRIHLELSLRAKGIVMAREAGLPVTIDESVKSKFAELAYLEKSIGKTGMLAIHPFLGMSRRDLWQPYLTGA